MALPAQFKVVWVVAVFVVVIGTVAAFLHKGSKPAVQEQVSQQLPQNIDLALHNALFTEMRQGVAVWELLAERAEYDKKTDVAHLTGIRMTFKKTGTRGAVTVTADKGDYSAKEKLVRLRGHVHLTSDDGIVFDTGALDYRTDHSRFRTADTITFRQQRLRLTAVGMVLDVKEQKAQFGSRIEAVVEGLK